MGMTKKQKKSRLWFTFCLINSGTGVLSFADPNARKPTDAVVPMDGRKPRLPTCI